MNYLKVLLSAFVIISQPVFAEDFSQAVKNKHFYIKPSQKNLEKLHEASTLVITCVDFRIQDMIEHFLVKKLHLQDSYDEIALPGASLAFVEKKYKSWGRTIQDTIGILKNLHKIKRVVFIDHMNCGAYKLLKGPALVASQESEYKEHAKTLKEAKGKVQHLFPELEVYSFVIYLDGHIEQID